MNLLKHIEVIEFIHLFLGREQRHSPCPRMERKNRGVSSDQKNHSNRSSSETFTSEYSCEEQQHRGSEASDEQRRGSEASDEQHRGSEASDEQHRGSEASDEQHRGSEASDEQHRGSEASDEQHRGSEASDEPATRHQFHTPTANNASYGLSVHDTVPETLSSIPHGSTERDSYWERTDHRNQDTERDQKQSSTRASKRRKYTSKKETSSSDNSRNVNLLQMFHEAHMASSQQFLNATGESEPISFSGGGMFEVLLNIRDEDSDLMENTTYQEISERTRTEEGDNEFRVIHSEAGVNCSHQGEFTEATGIGCSPSLEGEDQGRERQTMVNKCSYILIRYGNPRQ
jgi:hypothetical protein